MEKKISKNEKKEFQSLIKVLRPHVYITGNSTFKTLVQQLTGNDIGISTASTSSPPLPKSKKADHRQIPVIFIEEHEEGDCQSSPEFTYSFDSRNDEVVNEEMNQRWDHMYMKQQMDLLAVREIESWLLDI